MGYSIAENLQRILDERGSNANALAKESGVPQPTVFKILRGQVENPGVKNLVAIARALKISVDTLIDGESEHCTPYKPKQGFKMCPLLSWVQAGCLTEIELSEISDDDWYPCPISISERGYCLRVHGESMEPKFVDGDIVFVDPDRCANNGSIVIVVECDGCDEASATMKKLVKDGRTAYLKPLNPDWPGPKYIDFTENMRVVGVVIGKFVEV